MKVTQFIVAALALSAAAVSAQAHEFDPGGRVVVACPAAGAPRMADVARAVENSHYWAAQGTRREMLRQSRAVCAASDERSVAFVPPADQRYRSTQDSRMATAQ